VLITTATYRKKRTFEREYVQIIYSYVSALTSSICVRLELITAVRMMIMFFFCASTAETLLYKVVRDSAF